MNGGDGVLLKGLKSAGRWRVEGERLEVVRLDTFTETNWGRRVLMNARTRERVKTRVSSKVE